MDLVRRPGLLNRRPIWSKTKKVWTSEEGSVCFVQLKNDDVYVVKGSSRVVQELYASCVLLSTGVPCAAMRVVNADDSEWSDIKHALRKHAQKLNDDETTKNKVLNLLSGPLNRAQIMIIEYVEGIQLDMFLAKPVDGFMESDNLPQSLSVLGQMLAVDMFLQNSDRIPAPLWNNEGNGGNVMITKEGAVVAIDSLVVTLNPSLKKAKAYFDSKMQRLDAFLKELLEVLKAGTDEKVLSISKIIDRASDFFHRCTRKEIPIESMVHFVEGICIGILSVVEFTNKNLHQDLYKFISAMFTNTWMDGWASDLKLIHLDFFHETAPLLQNAADEIKKVKSHLNASDVHLWTPPKVESKVRERGSSFPDEAVAEAIRAQAATSKPPKKDERISIENRPKINFSADALKGKKADLGKKANKKTMFNPADLMKQRKRNQNKKGPVFNPADLFSMKSNLAKMKAPEKKAIGASTNAFKGPTVAERTKKAEIKNQIEIQAANLYKDTESRIHQMQPESTFMDALESFALEDLDLVFFDFDQTLTVSSKVKIDDGAKLRGGESSLKALKVLSEKVGNLFVVTANQPTVLAVRSVANEVRHLGLDDVFRCERLDREMIVSLISAEPMAKLNNKQVSQRLAVAISTLSDRTGEDLTRISARSVRFDADSGDVLFRLFQKSHDGSTNFSALSSDQKISSPVAAEVFKEYMSRTEVQRSPEDSDSLLFLNLESDEMFRPEAMEQKDVFALLEGFCETHELSNVIFDELCYGDAIEFKTSTSSGEGVKLAKCGNVICSKYNKAEAIEYVLSQLDHPSGENQGFQVSNRDLLSKKKLKIAFIDDSSDNVFSVFNFFRKHQKIEDISCIWFTPPSTGHNETNEASIIHLMVKKMSQISLMQHPRIDYLENHPEHGKVMLIQEAPRSISQAATLVSKRIEQSKISVSAVLLPEGFLPEQIKSDTDLESLFSPLRKVASDCNVLIVAGTVHEIASDGKYFTTCVVISSDGNILGSYRKRKVHNFETQAFEDKVGVFETSLGPIGVLICLDIEDPALLKETIDAGAKIIFNPVHIPYISAKAENDKIIQNWKHKLESMQRYLERICTENDIIVIRTDLPVAFGSGTSQIISPMKSETICDPRNDILLTDLRDSKEHPFNIVPASSYHRSDDKDNIGLRLQLQNLKMTGSRNRMIGARIGFRGAIETIQMLSEAEEVFEVELHLLKVNSVTSEKELKPEQFNCSNVHDLGANGRILFLDRTDEKLKVGRISVENKISEDFAFNLEFAVGYFILNSLGDKIICFSSDDSNRFCVIGFSHNRVAAALSDFVE